MKNIKMRIIGDGMGDWFTLYLDDKFVTHGHMINENVVVPILESLGYTIDFGYNEITDKQSAKYDGGQLPDDFNELGLE